MKFGDCYIKQPRGDAEWAVGFVSLLWKKGLPVAMYLGTVGSRWFQICMHMLTKGMNVNEYEN